MLYLKKTEKNEKSESNSEENENDEDDNEEENEELIDAEITYIPIIQGDKVIKININGGTLPLKRQITFKEFTEELMPLLMGLKKFLNLQVLTVGESSKSKSKRKIKFRRPWNQDDWASFWYNLNEKQQEFVKIVYENEEIAREHLIKDLIKKGMINEGEGVIHDFAGISAGLSRKINMQELEPLWQISSQGIYVMNNKVLSILAEFFENL